MHNYGLVLFLTLLWPALQLFIFFLRFGNLPVEMIIESAAFAPLGFLSVLIFLFFKNRSAAKLQKNMVAGGYIAGMPFALLGSLMGGLVFPPIIGVTIYGLMPLIVGMVVGFFLGKLFGTSKNS